MKKFFKIFFIFSFIICMKSKAALIIFDIGETLIKTDELKSFTLLGPLNTISYMSNFFIKNKTMSFSQLRKNIIDRYVEYLSQIPSPFASNNNECKAINGKPMAPLQRDNLLGKLSSKKCLQIGSKWFKEHKNDFATDAEYQIFKNIFKLNFHPDKYLKKQRPSNCLNLLKECYDAKDENGERKNFVVILSNQPQEALPYLKKYFPEIYAFSDAQIFSCIEECLKPNKSLFEKCISLCPDAKLIVYVDDEECQRNAAKEFNILAVDPDNAEKLIRDLKLI